MRLHIFFDLSKMIDNNLNLSICRVKVNCQIRKLKITKFKEQVMPTYCHIDSTDVIENDYIYVISTMADNKFRPACHCLDIKMWSRHYVQLTPFSIFVILVIVTAIVKIKIGKRSVHQGEELLQISYASAAWSVSYEKGEGNAKQLENLQFDKLTHNS
jgi:hypothetical protein